MRSLHILQYYAGQLNATIEKCLASVDLFFEGHDIVRILETDIKEDAIAISDDKRMRLHAEFNPSLWIDPDVEFFDVLPLDWDLSLPAFAYNNGHADSFMSYMPTLAAVEKFYSVVSLRRIQPVYGWHNKVIREYPHVQILDNENIWKHHRLSGTEKGKEHYEKLKNKEDYFPTQEFINQFKPEPEPEPTSNEKDPRINQSCAVDRMVKARE